MSAIIEVRPVRHERKHLKDGCWGFRETRTGIAFLCREPLLGSNL